MLRYLPFLLALALWIYAFIDCLTTPEEKVRHLPKVVWVIIILLFGEVLLGPVAWLIAGRPRGGPRRRAGRRRFVAPDDNPEFLRSLGRPEDGPDTAKPPEDGPPGHETPGEDRPGGGATGSGGAPRQGPEDDRERD